MTRTGADYLASLNDGRTVLLDGQRIDNVATHPAFEGAAHSVARLYDAFERPELRSTMWCDDQTEGDSIATPWLIPRSVEDLTKRREAVSLLAESSFGLMGRSPDHVASFFAGFAGKPSIFDTANRRGSEALMAYHHRASRENTYLSYTIIHPTIDRTKPPHQQYDDHLYVSVADERDDGIVLRGAQMLGTGSVLSDAIFVSCILPLPAGAEDYAISVVVPNNATGLRIHTRRPYALGATSAYDYPMSSNFDETDSLVVFDDVLVPWEHVFIDRDIPATWAQFNDTAAHSLGNTQAQIRWAVKLRMFAGLARQYCDSAGTTGDAKIKQRLGVIAGKASIPEAFVLAAEANATIDADGVARPDPGMLYAAMTLQPMLANEISMLMRELVGGSVIQVPSSVEAFSDPITAGDLERFTRWPEVPAADRIKLLKLIWDMIGSEFAGRHLQYEMFYAGDPSVVHMRSFAGYDWDRATSLVDRCLEMIPDPKAAVPTAT